MATSEYLPSWFKWFNWNEIVAFVVNAISENSVHVYKLEMRSWISYELHESHNAYLLQPEILKISCGMFSKYWSNIADEYGRKAGGANKLVRNLVNKCRYIGNKIVSWS